MNSQNQRTNAAARALVRVPTQRWVALGILILLVIVISIANPRFLEWDNINGIFQQVAAMGIVSLGAMMDAFGLTSCLLLMAGISLAGAVVTAVLRR